MNREIYRRARESSVRGAYTRLEEILADEGRSLVAIIALSLAAGLLACWPSRAAWPGRCASLPRPWRWWAPGPGSPGPGHLWDEIGDLARALET